MGWPTVALVHGVVLSGGEVLTVREACRQRKPLDGSDAQGLEHALTQLEQENSSLRQQIEGYEMVVRDLIEELLHGSFGAREAADELMTEFISKKRAANWGKINEGLMAAEKAEKKAREFLWGKEMMGSDLIDAAEESYVDPITSGRAFDTNRLRVGVDIDGVIYKWGKTVLYMMRDVLREEAPELWAQKPHTKDGPLGDESKITHWDYIQENVTHAQWKWLWTEGVRLGLFRYGHLYSGSIQAIRRLSEIGDVHLITHRPPQAVGDTLAWLAFQSLPIKGVTLLTNQEPKSGVKPECDVYIDDKPENCFDLSKNTRAKLVALMDQPWNAHARVWPVIRVHGWAEFIDQVRRVAS